MTTGRKAIDDPLAHDDETAREIGFALPERYNASDLLFANLARGHGERIAIRTRERAVSYGEICREASRWATALLALGLERGDRVMLLLDDTPTYPAAFFGAIRAGLVPMLINTQSTTELCRFYLEDSGAEAAVVDAPFIDLLGDDVIADTRLRSLVVNTSGEMPARRIAVQSVERFLAGASDAVPAADTHRDDMAFWMYSSGSTGRPKGVVHLQHDLAYTAASYGRHVLALRPDDICFSVPKIFFAYGLGNSLTFPFAVGASSVLMAGRPEPKAIVAHIATARPTVFFGLPTLYTALLASPALLDADLSSVRLWVSAAEVLASETAAAWRQRTGADIVEGLGSTEMAHIYLSNTPDARRSGSAGRRVPGYRLKLTDRDGEPVGEDGEGILWVKGHSSAPCYWNRADKTAETMRGEWIWTGDRFAVDGDGFYYFRGRADDLVKVSGQWVYPLEVELCLANHSDVRECAVAAHKLADERMTLRAFVVLGADATPSAATVKRLQDHVKSALLPYKYPRIVEFMDELPKTGTGKIDRQALSKRPPPTSSE